MLCSNPNTASSTSFQANSYGMSDTFHTIAFTSSFSNLKTSSVAYLVVTTKVGKMVRVRAGVSVRDKL